MNDDQIKIQQLENQVAELKDELKKAYQQLNQAYLPPKGVIGYARKDEIEQNLNDGSSYFDLGIDHPSCWEDQAQYPWLVALCPIDNVVHHDINVIEKLRVFLQSKNDQYSHVNDDLLLEYIDQIKAASGIT